MIVIDNDVISYFWLETDRTPTAKRARKKDPNWIAPYLWRSEFRSVLRQYMVQKKLLYSKALWYIEKAEHDMKEREYHVRSAEVLKLVEQTGHSSYDCEYVALAQFMNIPLVTGDRRLVMAFPNRAILLEDFVG